MWVVLPHVLLNESQLPIAKFSPGWFTKKHPATIELMDGNMSQEQLDEVVLTGLAVMQDTVYYTSVNASGAAGSGASAGVAAAVGA